MFVFDSKGLTKIQTIVIIVIIIGFVGFGLLFILQNNPAASVETIKIGILADLDNFRGSAALNGAILAAEQINKEGGILGKKFEIVSEDSDDEQTTADQQIAANALLKLITVDKADFILNNGYAGIVLPHQDICFEHKKIMFSLSTFSDTLTERVRDDYDRYKYFFRGSIGNETAAVLGNLDSFLTVRNYTGFNKLAFLWFDSSTSRSLYSRLSELLLENNFEIVYHSFFPLNTIDFSSYFSAIEASGAQIINPFTPLGSIIVNEWSSRQTPSILWGYLGQAQELNFWETSEGRVESVTCIAYPVTAGYALTEKTLPTRDAFLDRWGDVPTIYGAAAYDIVRFVIPEAIINAGSTETDVVIEALEVIDVETSSASHFKYTASHDLMIGENVNDPEGDYLVVCSFQWQNGNMIPMAPNKIREDAGASYIYPDWPGPWDNIS